LASRARAGESLDLVVVDALGWLSWLSAGLVGLSAAGWGREPTERARLEMLAALRGHRRTAVRDACALAAIGRILRLVLPAALLLALLALAFSGTLRLLPARLLLCVGVVGYVLALAFLVGGTGHVASLIAPRHGRSAFVALLFVPELLRSIWSELPSIPWVLGWLLDRLRAIGGALT
jgi:hypothetical protein